MSYLFLVDMGSKFQKKVEKKIQTGDQRTKKRHVYYDEKIENRNSSSMSKGAFILLIGLIVIGAGTGSYFIFADNNDNGDDNTTTSTTTTTTGDNPQVQMEIAGVGTIVIELYPEHAPNTVANFLSLVNSDFYDGLTFHRVISSFVAQGGDPNGDGTGGPGYYIDDEVVGNLLTHTYGAISMAKSEAPDTAGSQFFFVLNEGACSHLNGVHTVFGQVISGLDLLPLISEGDVMTTVFELDI
jgi:peptidyl-prolyl cis-trans isomerase B (cyclophilin B)